MSSPVEQRSQLTEDEHIQLADLCNVFWFGLGELVAKTLDQAPEELESQLLMMLEDRASCHGSPYEHYRKYPLRIMGKAFIPRTPDSKPAPPGA